MSPADAFDLLVQVLLYGAIVAALTFAACLVVHDQGDDQGDSREPMR